MAEKTVAVRLVALTNQYKASMASATAATARLGTTVGGTTGRISSSLGGPGGIALAAGVAAGAAIKLSYDFENAFTRIAAITDSSTAQVAQWKEEVLALSGETARAPQELADALYFLASAGLDANEIMPTLEMSAKAAAVGLGETGDIARLTANAMNAYAASGLKAAEVTDILVAAVREGTAEPDEFADAMGRILPVASKAGISFDQVAASLASVSNIGLDVNEGVTAMRGVLVNLLAPGTQAKDMLAELGLTAENVRQSLAQDGLIATLRLLEERTGGNIDMLRKIIPNVRAMTGAFGLTGQEAAKVDEIFKDVMESTGSMDRAFGETEKSAGHQLRQAFADLQAAGVELGAVLLPVFAHMARNAAAMAKAVVDVTEAISSQIPTAGKNADMMEQLGQKYRAGKIDIEDAAALLFEFGQATGKSAEEIQLQIYALQGAKVNTKAWRDELGNLLPFLGDTAEGTEDVGGAGEEAGGGMGKFADGLKDANEEMERGEKLAGDLETALMSLAGFSLDAAEAAIEWQQSLADLRKELRSGTKTLDEHTQAGRDNQSAILDSIDAAIEDGKAIAAASGSRQKGAKYIQDHIAQIRQEAIEAGFLKKDIDAYIRSLNLTPKQISTILKTVGLGKAKSDVQSFQDMLDAIPDVKDVLIRMRSSGDDGFKGQTGHQGGIVGRLPRMHQGGIASDEQMVLARKGEHILTPRQYAALTSARTHSSQERSSESGVKVAFYLDRRRFTDQLDHDAAYTGRW